LGPPTMEPFTLYYYHYCCCCYYYYYYYYYALRGVFTEAM